MGLHLHLFRKIANSVLAYPRIWKRVIAVLNDALLCALTVYFAFYLRLGYWVLFSSEYFYACFWAVITSLGFAFPVFIYFGLYHAIFRYSGLPALLAITKAVCLYGLAYALIYSVIGFAAVPRTIGLIQPLLLLLAIGASRAFVNVWLGGSYLSILKAGEVPSVLIYGAGSAGRQLAAALVSSHEMRVAGFIDDNPQLHGQIMHGHRIYCPNDLSRLINQLKIGKVFLAIPSIRRSERNAILKKLLHMKVSIRTLPGLVELAQGRVTVSDLRELDVEDLLERNPVEINENLQLTNDTKGHVIMITGAGGSIGSELCRQIIYLQPKELILVDHSEIAVYEIYNELLQKLQNLTAIGHPQISLLPILGSVVDSATMEKVISAYQPHIIYHAAAYKHVPLVEANPFEGIKNNTFGTLKIAQLAIKLKVPHFVLVSTDKAVNPTNIMGASKRLAEMILQAFASEKISTIFTIVRFGNVLASSGSVIPKFREQIKSGGPVTVTDFRMTRYFMTIPEAAILVIYAGSLAKGGEVFLLDMGEPVRIYDLAKRMIELSGYEVKDIKNPEGDVEIIEIGLRPGEKLYEELLLSDSPEGTSHPRIYKAREEFLPLDKLQHRLDDLDEILSSGDKVVLIKFLSDTVKGYQFDKAHSIRD